MNVYVNWYWLDCDSCGAASEMLMSNLDLRRKWNGAVEWLHDELERVSSTQCAKHFCLY